MKTSTETLLEFVDMIEPIHIHLIRIFEGPRHARCEEVWRQFAHEHRHEIALYVFDNREMRLSHDLCLQVMWQKEKYLPGNRAIFTEFDFLPDAAMCEWPAMTAEEPIQAAEYCTRGPDDALLRHGIPGAWFIRVQKDLLQFDSILNFRAGGKFNDPANELGRHLKGGARVKLLPQECCLPAHFGARTPGAGVHLFWSRHYNDSPQPGSYMARVLEGVDRALGV